MFQTRGAQNKAGLDEACLCEVLPLVLSSYSATVLPEVGLGSRLIRPPSWDS